MVYIKNWVRNCELHGFPFFSLMLNYIISFLCPYWDWLSSSSSFLGMIRSGRGVFFYLYLYIYIRLISVFYFSLFSFVCINVQFKANTNIERM